MQECRNPFIRQIFAGDEDSSHKQGKLNFISVGSKFKKQLGELMLKLRSTGTNFIRCIKPNVRMVAHEFEGAAVLSQLQCAGMTSVLELMQQGFPSRAQFSELYTMYKQFLPPDLARLDPRLFCKALFKALGLDESQFQFGLTKVFFRPGKFAEFDQMMKADPENLRQLILRVKRWLLCSRWRKVQWCALEVVKLKNKILYRRAALVLLQCQVRGWRARRQHRPRYQGIQSIRLLATQLNSLAAMGNNLKRGRAKLEQTVDTLRHNIDTAVATIRAKQRIPKSEIDVMYRGLVGQVQAAVKSVAALQEEERRAEEKERLARLQQEMERERRRKEEEEAERQRQEEQRKQKQEMEARRRLEEEEERRLEREERDRWHSVSFPVIPCLLITWNFLHEV